MSGQEEHDPFKWNKRSGRSMRGKNQRLHQEGMGSRTASHAVHTPPIHPLFSLFSCPYKISQQSHEWLPAREHAHDIGQVMMGVVLKRVANGEWCVLGDRQPILRGKLCV